MHPNQGALATLDVDQAVQQIANGVMLKQIAAQYGVDKSAVYRKLTKHPDYKDAVSLQAHSFVEDAMQDVMTADNETVNIARARVDAAFKYAKAHNEAYRDKQQIEHSGHVSGPSFTVIVSATPQRTIDAGCLIIEQDVGK